MMFHLSLESGIELTHIWTLSPNGCNRRRSQSRGEVTERFMDAFRTEVESSLRLRGPNGLSPGPCPAYEGHTVSAQGRAWPTRAIRSQTGQDEPRGSLTTLP